MFDNPTRRAVVGAGGGLLGANFMSSPALAKLEVPDKAPKAPPPGYNILLRSIHVQWSLAT